MHGFSTQIFANGRPQDGPPIAVTGEPREARTFDLEIPSFPFGIGLFAQENRAAISQLSYLMAELMA